MIDLKQIRQFIQVAECGSLLRAAEVLNMTQPGLSRSMHNLEELLGVSLFSRTKNSISLTETGRYALEVLRPLINQSEEAVRLVQEKDRRLSLARIASPAPTAFEKLAQRLTALYDGLDVETEVKNCKECVEGLYSGVYDLVILAAKPVEAELFSMVIEEESLYLLVPENHRLAAFTRGIHLGELDGETVLSMPQQGYWTNQPQRLLPHSRFISQRKLGDFQELIELSSLPTFTTDVLMERFPIPKGRVLLPLLDEELNLTLHLCMLSKNCGRFEKLIAAGEL